MTKKEEAPKEQTLEDFQAEVNAAVASKSDPVEKPAEPTPAPAQNPPPASINVPLEINEDGTISPRMAAALQEVAAKVPQQEPAPMTEEQRLAKIKFAGAPPVKREPSFLGRRRLAPMSRATVRKDPVKDLKDQIMGMRCPKCDSTTFRFAMEPRHFGLPSGVCPHCSHVADIVELRILDEKSALARLRDAGVDVEVDDV